MNESYFASVLRASCQCCDTVGRVIGRASGLAVTIPSVGMLMVTI